jgi:hypothetical protein
MVMNIFLVAVNGMLSCPARPMMQATPTKVTNTVPVYHLLQAMTITGFLSRTPSAMALGQEGSVNGIWVAPKKRVIPTTQTAAMIVNFPKPYFPLNTNFSRVLHFVLVLGGQPHGASIMVARRLNCGLHHRSSTFPVYALPI